MKKAALICLFMVSLPAGAESQSQKVSERPKVPYKIIFNNDCTNIGSCISPFNPNYEKGKPEYMPELLIASVDEAAEIGADVLCFAPGMGWTPWWKSNVVPDHYQWFRRRIAELGIEPNVNFIHRFVEEGGDVMQIVADRCTEKNIALFVSYRLNDIHHLENPSRPEISQFYHEHPEYRIGKRQGRDTQGRLEMVHNWVYPEVRNYKLALITELCENYDIAGFELDFLRHHSFFQVDHTTAKQRSDIMAGFVKQVRLALDRTAKPGRYRYLSVRIPDMLDKFDPIGIDIKKFAAAGVDIFNVSSYYNFSQKFDIDKVKRLADGKAVFYEVTHTPGGWTLHIDQYDASMFRRPTDQMLYTTAHLAYRKGADGISLFNFQYFRPFGNAQELRGPFNEPPYHVIEEFKNPERLKQKDQHYFLSMKHVFNPDQQREYWMELSPTAQILQSDTPARLRAHIILPGESGYPDRNAAAAEETSSRGNWRVWLNGVELKPTDQTGELYENRYTAAKGEPHHWIAWSAPKEIIVTGRNEIQVKLVSGWDKSMLMWLELGLAK